MGKWLGSLVGLVRFYASLDDGQVQVESMVKRKAMIIVASVNPWTLRRVSGSWRAGTLFSRPNGKGLLSVPYQMHGQSFASSPDMK